MNNRSAFTLIELLVVMGIIVVLMTLIAPVSNRIVGANQITGGADKIVTMMIQARQTSLTKNHTVELRFYQYADPSQTGETAGAPDTGKFRAMQAVELLPDGTTMAIGKAQKLDSTVIIDSNPTLSSILDTSAQDSSGNSLVKTAASWTTNDPQIPVSPVGTKYNCSAFQFRSGGGTTLAPFKNGVAQNWFLTVHSIRDGDNRTQPPANFVTIQIDAISGSVKSFRP